MRMARQESTEIVWKDPFPIRPASSAEGLEGRKFGNSFVPESSEITNGFFPMEFRRRSFYPKLNVHTTNLLRGGNSSAGIPLCSPVEV